MDNSQLIDSPIQKRPVPASLRKPQILALQAAGLTLEKIANIFNVSIKTIQRDLEDIAPAKEHFNSSTVDSLLESLRIVISPDDRALRYAELALKAKNEAVSLGALQRIDDLDGIVTQKELVRTRRDEQHNIPGPMFILQPGVSVNVTVNEQDVRNVTPMNIQSDDEQKG